MKTTYEIGTAVHASGNDIEFVEDAEHARSELPSMIMQLSAEQMEYVIACLIQELPAQCDKHE